MRVLAVFCSALLVVLPLLAADQPTNDDRIYDQVNLKLVTDREVGGARIEVEVKEAVVTLRGRVRTDRIRNKAGKLAGKVKGVKKVVNELTVGPPAVPGS